MYSCRNTALIYTKFRKQSSFCNENTSVTNGNHQKQACIIPGNPVVSRRLHACKTMKKTPMSIYKPNKEFDTPTQVNWSGVKTRSADDILKSLHQHTYVCACILGGREGGKKKGVNSLSLQKEVGLQTVSVNWLTVDYMLHDGWRLHGPWSLTKPSLG